MTREYWIVNDKTKKYMKAPGDFKFDGEWKEQFKHTKGVSWLDVTCYSLVDFDMANGIPYVYDLCMSGMLCSLIVDTKLHDAEAIKKAKSELRVKHDIVSLNVVRLEEVAA